MTDTVKDTLTAAGAGPHRIATPLGPITVTDMTVTVDPETGATVVEVQAGAFTDPHIRVINPPRYVPDPNGPVLMGEKRFRDDPLAALGHVIVQHGGGRPPARGAP